MRSFFSGDLDAYRTFTDLADAIGGERPLCITLSVAGDHAMRIDMSTAATTAASAVDQARRQGDPIDLAFALAVLAQLEELDESTAAVHAREAVDLARMTGAQASLVFALYSLASVTKDTDPDQALIVCDECVRIDRTQRRAWSNACRAVAAGIHLQRGELAEGLLLYRSALHHFDFVGDRLQTSVLVSLMAEALAAVDPATAIQLAAIAESDAIAPNRTFGAPQNPNLAATLGELASSQLDPARSRAAAMSYDDALRFAFATIDRTDQQPEPR
jgi:hypothetical protein